jgi:hypothetical protein
MDYITAKMAEVGCGKSDIAEIKAECGMLGKESRDILDCWHNNGFNIPLLPEFKGTAAVLKEQHTADELICLAAYVAARRNLEEY